MNKLKNNGQALAIFVILIPAIIMVGILITDVSYAKYQERKLSNISNVVLRYGLKHIEEEPLEDMINLIYKNEDEIDSYNIKIDENKITLELCKSSPGFLGKIIGKEIYEEKAIYTGYINEGKISIKKGDR